MVGDAPVFDNEVELADKGPEGSRFGHPRVPPVKRLANALVRVSAEDVVHTAGVGQVGKVELLGEAEVRQHEHHRAAFALAQRHDVPGEVLSRVGEANAA